MAGDVLVSSSEDDLGVLRCSAGPFWLLGVHAKHASFIHQTVLLLFHVPGSLLFGGEGAFALGFDAALFTA